MQPPMMMPMMPDDGMGHVIQFEPPEPTEVELAIQRLAEMAQSPNVAEELDESKLGEIGDKVVREYDIDEDSRQEWKERAQRAMDLARQKKKAKTFPWAGASNVKYPLLTTAALQFAARAYPAICDGPRIVKCQVLGFDPDGVKESAGDRVSQHMSYQLLYEVDSWEADMDTALHQIPIVGCAFKKIYEDQSEKAGFGNDLVSAFDLVVNQSTKSLKTVPRATHCFTLYPHEIAQRQRAGRFLDVNLKGESDDNEDDDAPHDILEQHRYLDLDEDGVEEPWIVTVHKRTHKVLRIVACFDPQEIKQDGEQIIEIPRRQYFVKIPFIPDPEGGFYDVGFGHLLEPLSDVIDTTINQMMDAGTLQNAGGGFIAAGVALGKGQSVVKLKPGEYHTIQSASQDLRQAIYNFDHPGPSQVLFNLLGLIIEAGKDVAAIQDILIGDMPRNQTATTTMAMIEQGLKVFTAIYKRIFRALKEEFKLIFDINKRSQQLRMPKYVALLDKPIEVVANDYMGEMDVMPVADPNTVTDMQRMSKAQFVLEEAKGGNPHVDVYVATKRAFEAARIDNPEEVLIEPPPPDAPKPPSPEEQAAELDRQAKQTDLEAQQQQAQIKAQSAQMDLAAKHENLVMQLEAKQREMEQKAIENEMAHQQQLRDLQIKSEEMDMRWRELQVKEQELKAKREQAATAKSE